jgi:large subunit ribosomal protein L6
MSRVGRAIIKLNNLTKIIDKGQVLDVVGPLGILTINKVKNVEYILDNDKASVESTVSALSGTGIRLLQSAVNGVNKKFEKVLEIIGSGTKVELKGRNLELSLGYTHLVIVVVPDNIDISVTTGQKSVITLKSMSASALGDFAAEIGRKRKSRPYGDFVIHDTSKPLITKKKGGANA